MSIGKIIGIVSALALMVAVTAYTEANATSAQTTGEMSTKQSPILAGMQKDMVQNWNQVKADFKGARLDTQNQINSNTNMMFSTRTTATGMIGQPIRDTGGNKIATLKDIILDSTGKAVLAVVSDGGIMGMGDKRSALDYALIVQQNADGDIMMPVSKVTLKKVAPFSYDTSEASDTVQVIPNNGYSVAQLLHGKILDQNNAPVGNIENIAFRGGKASQVIVSQNGNDHAVSFDDLTIARRADGTADFRMNSDQSAQLN